MLTCFSSRRLHKTDIPYAFCPLSTFFFPHNFLTFFITTFLHITDDHDYNLFLGLILLLLYISDYFFLFFSHLLNRLCLLSFSNNLASALSTSIPYLQLSSFSYLLFHLLNFSSIPVISFLASRFLTSYILFRFPSRRLLQYIFFLLSLHFLHL